MFSGCTLPPDSKETKLVSSDQEASPSACKNIGGSFSAMFAHGSASLQLFLVVRVAKITSKIGVLLTHSLPLYL